MTDHTVPSLADFAEIVLGQNLTPWQRELTDAIEMMPPGEIVLLPSRFAWTTSQDQFRWFPDPDAGCATYPSQRAFLLNTGEIRTVDRRRAKRMVRKGLGKPFEAEMRDGKIVGIEQPA